MWLLQAVDCSEFQHLSGHFETILGKENYKFEGFELSHQEWLAFQHVQTSKGSDRRIFNKKETFKNERNNEGEGS